MGNIYSKTQEEIAAERLQGWRESAKVSAFQAYQALDDKGYMEQVEAIMADAATPKKTVRAWNTATEFKRMSPTVQQIGEALGLTEEQKDELFEYAATIEA